jgi:uncharacterized Zn finger protein (UPF0148 family)
MSAAVLTKTVDTELVALAAGEDDECLVCGEPLAREEGVLACSVCGSRLRNGPDLQVQLRLQAG